MKKFLFISALTCFGALFVNAQDDDMYYTPLSQKAKQEALERYEREHPTYYCGSKMSVDEYNRRCSSRIVKSDSIGSDTISLSGGYGIYPNDSMTYRDEDYKYSRRLERFYDGRPVNVYIVNNDPWYYDPWYYDPWYWDSWYYGPRYRFSISFGGWYGPAWAYDPWFHRPGWYGPGWWGGVRWHEPVVVSRGIDRGRVVRRNDVSGRGVYRGGTGAYRGGDIGSRNSFGGYSGSRNTFGGGGNFGGVSFGGGGGFHGGGHGGAGGHR